MATLPIFLYRTNRHDAHLNDFSCSSITDSNKMVLKCQDPLISWWVHMYSLQCLILRARVAGPGNSSRSVLSHVVYITIGRKHRSSCRVSERERRVEWSKVMVEISDKRREE